MNATPEPPELSLVLGGPLFQLYLRTRLSGDALELLSRRILVITSIVWLPLLIMSPLQGQAIGGAIGIPFLYDVEAQCRFLIALPMLIGAEAVVHRLIGPLVRRFAERRIVMAEDLPRLNAAVNSALRIRNSAAVELTLVAVVYTVGLWIWRSQVASGGATWYARPEANHLQLTPAGYWYAFVSIPIFQFILLRWYMRLVIWFHFLWQVSRLNLQLTAAHPDGAGGIGFLGGSSYAFSPLLFSQGALLSGVIGDHILYEGRSLMYYKLEAAGLVGFYVLFLLGPLLMFTPMLFRARLAGLAKYGLLANRYAFGFEKKWMQGGLPEARHLVGTPDIRALADMANSYAVVTNMRIVPFGVPDIIRLAAATAAPLLPLALTTFSVDELFVRIIKIII